MPLAPGDVVEGKVAKLVKFGVIVELPEGRSGLVHISEIADRYVRDVADYFEEGDAVRVKVLGTDDKGRLQLSAKQAEAREPIRPVDPGSSGATGGKRGPASFEDRLAAFMKSSEQRLVELRRNRGAKRKKRRRK
jgi:S1 RNA binding domain protein